MSGAHDDLPPRVDADRVIEGAVENDPYIAGIRRSNAEFDAADRARAEAAMTPEERAEAEAARSEETIESLVRELQTAPPEKRDAIRARLERTRARIDGALRPSGVRNARGQRLI